MTTILSWVGLRSECRPNVLILLLHGYSSGLVEELLHFLLTKGLAIFPDLLEFGCYRNSVIHVSLQDVFLLDPRFEE